MLSTPFRRASFVVAIVGAITLCVGAYDWLTSFPNTLIWRTTYIPDYPRPDDQFFRKSVIQVHRACEWRDSPPPNVNMFDPSGPVLLHDEILSLDKSCANGLLLTRQSRNAPGALFVSLSKRSHQLMLREAIKSDSYINENLSARSLYRRAMVEDMVKHGVLHLEATQILDQCTKSEAKFCVEVNRRVYVHAWSVLWSTWPLALGFVFLVAGLAGSLFVTQLAALWRISGGRLVEWIRRG